MAKQKGIGAAPNYTDEERTSLFEAVCVIYETQRCTVESACEAVSLSSRTFYLWKGQYAECAERYKKAKTKQQEHYWQDIIAPLAETALQRLLTGERKVESKMEPLVKDGLLTGDSRTIVTEGEILPNATAVIFTMKGLYPGMFTDRHEVTGKDGSPLMAGKLSDEKLDKLIDLINGGDQ